jgi:hypothetical protein
MSRTVLRWLVVGLGLLLTAATPYWHTKTLLGNLIQARRGR